MFVLIPGAGGSDWYWNRLEPLLNARGHQTLPIQLPADDPAAGLEQYAACVVEAVAEPRTDLVVVAQSLGGFTAPLVCVRLPVAQLVFVNAMIPKPGETPGEWWPNTGQAEAKRANDMRQGRRPDAAFDVMVDFLHDVPPDVLEEMFKMPEPVQSKGPFASRLPPDDTWMRLPMRAISGREDRFFPIEFQRRVARERLGMEPDEVPGGHLVALSEPEALAERLLTYAAER